MDPSGNNGEFTASWYSEMWWISGVDGPILIGDAVYVVGRGVVYLVGKYIPAVVDKIPGIWEATVDFAKGYRASS
ncbi:hypothetical protein [Tissierella sp.]|uniref:hypothetical protein n=1 Tax=Tissierella sp. TaxID=41274 RepID=UPI0028A9200C|nr:hypothetical protein [Tissierella sp.]